MTKALLYKEWLKIRWAALIMLGISLLVIIKIALNIAYGIRFYEANAYWYEVIIRGFLFYEDLMYVPLLAGTVIGIAQYFPEMVDKRLKLTLHLPLPENFIFLYMVFIGTLALIVLFTISQAIVSMITINYFPVQVLRSVWLTTFTWYLGGFVGYWAAAMIFVEPVWLKRILLIMISYSLYSTLIYGKDINQYQYSWHWFLILSLTLSIASLYTGNRFRKGVM